MTGVCLLCLLCGDSSTGLSPNLYSLSLDALGAQPSNCRTRSVTRFPPEFFVTGGSSLFLCKIYLGLSCLLVCVIVFRLSLAVAVTLPSVSFSYLTTKCTFLFSSFFKKCSFRPFLSIPTPKNGQKIFVFKKEIFHIMIGSI